MEKYSYREPKTTVEFTPTLNSVLIKISYMLGMTAITSDKVPAKISKSLTVAGYGENTYGFNIGDVVYMNNDFKNVAPFLILLPGNQNSMAERNRMIAGLTKDQIMNLTKEGKQFLMEDYIVVPSYGILGYLPKESTQAQIILQFKDRDVVSQDKAKEYFDLN